MKEQSKQAKGAQPLEARSVKKQCPVSRLIISAHNLHDAIPHMKTLLVILIVSLVSIQGLIAQSGYPRMVTLVLNATTTNSEQRVESFETVRVVSSKYDPICIELTVVKGSDKFTFYPDEVNGRLTASGNTLTYMVP
jgi:hypothetical protein